METMLTLILGIIIGILIGAFATYRIMKGSSQLYNTFEAEINTRHDASLKKIEAKKKLVSDVKDTTDIPKGTGDIKWTNFYLAYQ